MALLFDYVAAIGWQWWALLGGLELALILMERLGGWKISRWQYVVALLVFVPIAGFNAWLDQRGITERVTAERNEARENIARVEGQLDQARRQRNEAIVTADRLHVRLQGQASHRKVNAKQLQQSQKELQEAKKDRQEMSERLASLEAGRADEAAKRNELDRHVGPWKLDDEQKAALSAALKAAGPHNFTLWSLPRADSSELAYDIGRTFEASGWRLLGVRRLLPGDIVGGDGVWISAIALKAGAGNVATSIIGACVEKRLLTNRATDRWPEATKGAFLAVVVEERPR